MLSKSVILIKMQKLSYSNFILFLVVNLLPAVVLISVMQSATSSFVDCSDFGFQCIYHLIEYLDYLLISNDSPHEIKPKDCILEEYFKCCFLNALYISSVSTSKRPYATENSFQIAWLTEFTANLAFRLGIFVFLPKMYPFKYCHRDNISLVANVTLQLACGLRTAISGLECLG